MEKDRSSRVIAVVALVISIIGLSLGFAAFSNILVIKPIAKVEVTSDKFNVIFSKEPFIKGTSVKPNTATTIEPDEIPSPAFTQVNTQINITGTEISDLGATFTEPGQYAIYTFYAANIGEYDAYLTTISFEDYTTGKKKVCQKTAGTG